MGYLTMSTKERQLKALLEMVKRQQLTLKKVSEQMGLSHRQIKRIYKRYRMMGDPGLIHKSRGRLTNRQHPHKTLIIEQYQARYEGFGPTLAAEKLSEEGLKVDHETLRRWLLANGLWCKKRERSPYRQRRERRAQFGELVQMDGSIHDWFLEGELKCLINMVDDATGKTLSRLEEGETTEGVLQLLWNWIERYGIPLALYVDLKTVYVSPKTGNFSHIETACQKLGIQVIKAYSPQAKGRVERNHAVYQDHFVKELKLKDIRTIAQANQLLERGFIDGLNERFEKAPRIAESAHRPVGLIDLNQMLCWEYQRSIQNDWTFSFEGKCYQVSDSSEFNLYPRASLCVRRHLDKTVSAHYRGQRLEIKPLPARPSKIKQRQPVSMKPKKATRPSETHPWRRYRTIKPESENQLFKVGVDDPAGRMDNPDEKPSVFHRSYPHFTHTSPEI